MPGCDPVFVILLSSRASRLINERIDGCVAREEVVSAVTCVMGRVGE